MITSEIEFEVIINDINENLEVIFDDFEKYKDDLIEYGLIQEMRETWHEYVRPMHPRRDWQRKPYWLRVRSNPMRRGYH